jgi:hypothetical protein
MKQRQILDFEGHSTTGTEIYVKYYSKDMVHNQGWV